MSASVNQVFLIGRLGRDPEVRNTQSGSVICNLNLATDESYTDRDGNKQERTEWHRVVATGRPAEACGKYLHKDSLAFVAGALRTRKWQAQDGSEKYVTEIWASKVQFLDQQKSQGQQQSQTPQQRVQQPTSRTGEQYNEPPAYDSEVPF